MGKLVFGIHDMSELNITAIIRNLNRLGCSSVSESLVYNQSFLSTLLKALLTVYNVQGNSFIQEETLVEVSKYADSIDFCFYDEAIDKYNTGNMYNYLYNALRKEGCSNCKSQQSGDVADYWNSKHSITVATYLTLSIWRYKDMGELTDAIRLAIGGLNNEIQDDAESSNDLNEIRQKMADMGMTVDGYKKQETAQPKHVKQPEKVQKIPEPQADTEDEEDEICCKVQGNNFVFMIPVGTKMDRVSVEGIEFDALVVSLPDLNKTGLQVLTIQKEQKKQEEKKEVKPTVIVRIPIILDKKEKKSVETVDESASGDLDELKARKAELDALIKAARQNGDTDEVERLRKSRRKVRAQINSLG